MKIKAVVFDMDGLIFDTERISRETWKLAEKEFSFSCSEEFLSRLIGVSHQNIFEIYTDYFGNYDFGKSIYEWRHKKIVQIMETDGIGIKPGVPEIFDYLTTKGIPMALATSSDREKVDFSFRHANLRNPFKIIISGDMIKHSKPHPEIYLQAAKALNTSITECMVLEDSINGVLGANASGAVSVMIPDMIAPTKAIQESVFAIKKSLFDVIALIESINKKEK